MQPGISFLIEKFKIDSYARYGEKQCLVFALFSISACAVRNERLPAESDIPHPPRYSMANSKTRTDAVDSQQVQGEVVPQGMIPRVRAMHFDARLRMNGDRIFGDRKVAQRTLAGVTGGCGGSALQCLA
jgi:hypothetical protein